MNTFETALQQKHTRQARSLYMAFELGEKNWKLALAMGHAVPAAVRWPRATRWSCSSASPKPSALRARSGGEGTQLLRSRMGRLLAASLAARARHRQIRSGFCPASKSTAVRDAP